MNRWITRSIFWLVIGAVLNVTFVWGLLLPYALIPDFREFILDGMTQLTPVESASHTPPQVPTGWPQPVFIGGATYRFFEISAFTAQEDDGHQTFSNLRNEVAGVFSYAQADLLRDGLTDREKREFEFLDRIRTDLLVRMATRERSHTIYTSATRYSYGWPFRSMTRHSITRLDRVALHGEVHIYRTKIEESRGPIARIYHHGLTLDGGYTVAGQKAEDITIPIKPVALGFAANSVFYGTAVASPFVLFGMGRRWRRRRAGW